MDNDNYEQEQPLANLLKNKCNEMQKLRAPTQKKEDLPHRRTQKRSSTNVGTGSHRTELEEYMAAFPGMGTSEEAIEEQCELLELAASIGAIQFLEEIDDEVVPLLAQVGVDEEAIRKVVECLERVFGIPPEE